MEHSDFPAVIAGAQLGADWAWRELYASVAEGILGYARAKGVRDPEDLVGDVFLRLAEAITDFCGSEAQFRSWTFTIAHNRIVDSFRQQSRRPTEPIDRLILTLPSTATDPESDALARIGVEAALDLLDILSENQRDVVLLRVLGGLSVDEVAKVLGRRPGTIRVQQHRALQRLQGRMAQSTKLDVTP